LNLRVIENSIDLLSPGSSIMRNGSVRVGAVVALFACAALCIAQSTPVSDKFIISAKAGGVNAVFGDVTVEREDGRTGRLLKGDEVQIGERVTTGKDGKAEVLMNPGSYVRLGPSSSFSFLSTDLDSVQLKMYSGSAIIEVLGTEGFNIELTTDTARFTILQTGVYRIDAADKGSTVAIWKGKLQAGTDKRMIAGGGKQVVADGSIYSIVKFDRDIQDELALWSRGRARDLSRMSASLRPDNLRNSLVSSFSGNRWNFYDSFGLWIFNPFYSSYCFLPFGYGWQSPYGFGFGRSIWFYDLPHWMYRQPAPSTWSGNGNVNGTATGTGLVKGTRSVPPVEPNPYKYPTRVNVDASALGDTKDPSGSRTVTSTNTVSFPRAEPVMVMPEPSTKQGRRP